MKGKKQAQSCAKSKAQSCAIDAGKKQTSLEVSSTYPQKPHTAPAKTT